MQLTDQAVVKKARIVEVTIPAHESQDNFILFFKIQFLKIHIIKTRQAPNINHNKLIELLHFSHQMRFPKARPKMLHFPFYRVYLRTRKIYPFLPLKNEEGQ